MQSNTLRDTCYAHAKGDRIKIIPVTKIKALLQGKTPQILVVMAFISFKLLLNGNMGEVNEVDILPFAKQYADPNWIPGDWYLNQPPGYRLLFLTLYGKLTVIWGLFATSLIGRLLCYALVSSELVLLGRKLGLSLPLLLLAVGLFLYVDSDQGVAAHEWLVGGFEPKSVTYGLLLLAVRLMLDGRYCLMALMLGLATSFHALVGGWAFLAVVGWLVLRRKTDFADIRYLGSILLIYLATSGFAVWTVLEQLFTPTPAGSVKPSYVYVFLRSPNHLNPLSWSSNWWLKPLIYLLVLALSVGWLWRQRHSQSFSKQYSARIGLAEFTLMTLVPFILGLVVAPFDSQGSFLQYYPFRLGDIMLPLNTCLLLACALEQTWTGRGRRNLVVCCILLLSLISSVQAVRFQQQLLAVHQFPSQQQGVDSEWKALCTWVRSHTPKNAVVVSPPAEFDNFTWLAERPTIAKFKLVPPTKASVIGWYERLTDLSGDLYPWPIVTNKEDNKSEIENKLTTGYNHLSVAEAENLMMKYRADYFVTRIEHQLDLPIAYRNSVYILYGKIAQRNL
ncbi:MAG: hypothetical protein KME08_01745 [Aphanothece sp. CMT-3BRIN-NPC111]|nr:hypothetical protein [Aphanothece sp. CMT-3BRIN-NPC111]